MLYPCPHSIITPFTGNCNQYLGTHRPQMAEALLSQIRPLSRGSNLALRHSRHNYQYRRPP